MMSKRSGNRSGWLIRDTRGSVAIQVGIALIALIGMVALGSEVGFLFLKHRQLQSAADGAAVSGAIALATGNPADFRAESYAVSSAAGFTKDSNGVTITVNSPPKYGSHTADTRAVEAIVGQPQAMGLLNLFLPSPIAVSARAVASTQATEFCMLALDPSASGAIFIWNNATVSNPVCGVADNSASSSALVVRNNGAINGPVNVHGGWSLEINAELNGSPNVSGGDIIDDPYADRIFPAAPACTAQSGQAGNGATVNLSSGHFCSGWDFGNSARINLAAGIYYIDTKLSLGNNVIINGTGGVTIMINGNFAVTFPNGTIMTLTAPTTGPFAGLAIVSGRTALSSVAHTFDNGSTMTLVGAIYLPNQIVNFQNGSGVSGSRCTQIIARIINVRNNAWLNNNCTGTGGEPISANGSVQLVE